MKFSELLESPRYQALDEDGQQKARAGYVQKVVAKNPKYQSMSTPEKQEVVNRILHYGVDDTVQPVKHSKTFTEGVAPLAHAGSALLFDVPKAVVAKAGEVMGVPKEAALQAVFPEQETFAGKSLRFGASVPAYILGGNKIKALGGLNTVSKVSNPLARAGLEGLAYTAPYAGAQAVYDTPEAAATNLALGAGIGAGVGAAGVGLEKAQQGAKWLSKQTMKEWLKPKEKFMRYGKSPETVVQTERILANNANDLLSKLKSRAGEIGSDIDTALSNYDGRIDVSGAVKVVQNRIDDLIGTGKRENASAIKRLEDIRDDLIENIGSESRLSAKDAFDLKNRIIKNNKVNPFSQSADADRLVAETKRNVYRAISNNLKRDVKGARQLFDRYSNIRSAIDSLDNRINVSDKNMLVGMGQAVHTGIGAALGGAATGVVTLGLSQYMKTAHGRTRIANALWRFGNLGIKPTSAKAAPIIEEVLNGDPALSKMFKGGKDKAKFAEVLEEMQGLPAAEKRAGLPGGTKRPALPNLPAEGVYNDIRGGQKPIRLGSMVPEEAPMLPPGGLNRLPFISEATPVRMQPNRTVKGSGFTFNPRTAATGRDVSASQRAQRTTGRMIEEFSPVQVEQLENEAQNIMLRADTAQERMRMLMQAREYLKGKMTQSEAQRYKGDFQDLSVKWATGKPIPGIKKVSSDAYAKDKIKTLTEGDEVVESLQKETKRQPAGEVLGEIERSSDPVYNRPPQAGGSGGVGSNSSQGATLPSKTGSKAREGVPPPNDEPGKASTSSTRINPKNLAIATTAGVGGVSMATESDAASGHKIDHSFIDEREGYSAKPYVPKYRSGKVIDNSGVTIGSGVDLGQLSEQGLKSLGVSQAIINKVKPALGVKGQKALGLTGKVNLDSKEIKQLSDKVREANFSKYIQYYEKQTGKKFSALPAPVQTAVGSVITQYGPSLVTRAPKFNKAVLAGSVKSMDKELRNFGDKYPSRRKKEADLLSALL
jgi:hypothetical protein